MSDGEEGGQHSHAGGVGVLTPGPAGKDSLADAAQQQRQQWEYTQQEEQQGGPSQLQRQASEPPVPAHPALHAALNLQAQLQRQQDEHDAVLAAAAARGGPQGVGAPALSTWQGPLGQTLLLHSQHPRDPLQRKVSPVRPARRVHLPPLEGVRGSGKLPPLKPARLREQLQERAHGTAEQQQR